MIKKLIGFTLAELMLVIGIIGVVSILAMAAMRTDVNEQKTVTQLRKVAVTLQDSYAAGVEKYGIPHSWVTSSTTAEDASSLFASRLSEFLNTSSVTGNTIILKDGTWISCNISDGSTIISNLYDYDHALYPHYVGLLRVDLNGESVPPNTMEVDRFYFVVSKNGIEPAGLSLDSGVMHTYDTTAWVIKTGNMDYLKCQSELDWNTKRTCN